VKPAPALTLVLVLSCAFAPCALAGGTARQGTPLAHVVTGVIPAGVTIAGIAVGGQTPGDAYDSVRAAFQQPLSLVLGRHEFEATPSELGAVGFARQALTAALRVAPGTTVPLPVSVRPGPLRTYLRHLASGFNRRAVDATLVVRDGRPNVTEASPGVRLDVERALAAVSTRLAAGGREPVTLPQRAVRPKVTAQSFGPLIVIHRAANRLDLYRGAGLEREFQVATGQAQYPTPLGTFSIVVMWKDPWWYPPASPWAAGEKPTPPGPGNPLGTRWMGLSAPGVGIHGTPEPGSIGYSLSHGCIRMLIPQAEWLFDHVDIGTPVYIVAS
jgi:lipoprotein-anchoring transpeptidase ErfK/SrfK